MNKSNLKVVIGLGKTGISCIRYLMQQQQQVAVVDSRVNPPGLDELKTNYPDLPIHLGDFAAPFLSQASELIVSPGVALQQPEIAACIKQGIPAIGDIELFARAVKAPVVAITGSNGKSTVTTLVGEMAKAANLKVKVGGNLGTCALDLLDAASELYVLELSSFQLETTSNLKPVAATLLNVSEDHMDRYASLAEYATAKQRIFIGSEVAVINREEPFSYNYAELPRKIVSFGLDLPPTDQDFGFDSEFLFFGKQKLLPAKQLKIKGLHNVANALASLALGRAVKLPMSAMLKALIEFPGLAHRCEWVATINGVAWYNDSKGTNVGATQSAIAGLGGDIKGKIILLAGGLGKDADFSGLREPVAQFVRAVILFGKDAKIIANALAPDTKIIYADSMHGAVQLAANVALANDAVLLSPACASFDMFKNFEHRGEMFMEEVKKLLVING